MKKLPIAMCAEVCDPGALVSWPPPGGNAVGVVTELIQGGQQLRVRFKGGEERIFVAAGRAIERVVFEPNDAVQLVASGTIGVVLELKQVGRKIQYKVSLPGNEIKTVLEASLRPAVLTDPVERLRTGAVGNPRGFALRSAAARHSFANRYDEFTSLGNSRIEAKPHQISVAHRVVNAYPHRFLLCDEVGLGKTIEAGIVLKELRARGMAKRVLVLAPASLLSQWQFELKTKFNESFAVYNGASTKWLKQTSDENVWTLNDSIIASHGFASYSEERME
ncbi:MAG: SNF2-related protein, partial [Actinomycetota bacterium]|nr:SNF2-related protein [Actinomycetota bacterium]